MQRLALLVSALLALITMGLTSDAYGQKLYGLEGAAGFVHEFTLMPGPPCNQPNPTFVTWPFIVPSPCGGPTLVPTPPPGLDSWGDVATDSLNDTVFVCDGFHVAEFAEFNPLKGTLPGTIINSFGVPLPGPGPVTGLGMDELGLITGFPTLLFTDGFLIWGMAPSAAGTCAPPVMVLPPFPTPFPMPPGVLLTDVTFDPTTLSLLLCDSAGFVHSVLPGGAPGPWGFFPAAGPCGLMPTLEGIGMDLATTPSAIGMPPVFWITDGMMVDYLDVFGMPAPPQFYAPMPCTPTPAPLNGLAYVNHSIGFGVPPGTVTLRTFGQPSSPGPSYGVVLSGVPSPAYLWLVWGVNVPGPGYFCPPKKAAANPLYVDVFTPPGGYSGLFVIPAGVTAFPAAIPPGLPAGIEVYVQFFLDFTPGAPGGPFRSTDAIDLVLTAP